MVALDLMEHKQREQAILWRYEKRKQFIARRRAKERLVVAFPV